MKHSSTILQNIRRRNVNFAKVAQTSELASGAMKKVKNGKHEILLANIDGAFYAIANNCTHNRGELCKGGLRDGIVTCPNHGARFDVKTGQAVGGARVLF